MSTSFGPPGKIDGAGIHTINAFPDERQVGKNIMSSTAGKKTMYPLSSSPQVGSSSLRTGEIAVYSQQLRPTNSSKMIVSTSLAGLSVPEASLPDSFNIALIRSRLSVAGVVWMGGFDPKVGVKDQGVVLAVAGTITLNKTSQTSRGGQRFLAPGTVIFADLPREETPQHVWSQAGRPTEKYTLELVTEDQFSEQNDLSAYMTDIAKRLNTNDTASAFMRYYNTEYSKLQLKCLDAACANIAAWEIEKYNAIKTLIAAGATLTTADILKAIFDLNNKPSDYKNAYYRGISGFNTFFEARNKWKIGIVLKDKGDTIDVLLTKN